jgi:hypothetical protein
MNPADNIDEVASSGGPIIPPFLKTLLRHIDFNEDDLIRALAQRVTSFDGEPLKDARGFVKKTLQTFTRQLAHENNRRRVATHPAYGSTELRVVLPSTSDLRRAQVFPFLAEIFAIGRSRAKEPKVKGKYQRFERTLTYMLHRDLYLTGIYDPYSGHSVLEFPLDWIYFPDLFKKTTRQDREDFWWLLCRNGRYDLFVHTAVRLSRVQLSDEHTELYRNLALRFCKLCIDYGDYHTAERLLDGLEQSISESEGVTELAFDLMRLRFQASSHLRIHHRFSEMARGYFRCSRALALADFDIDTKDELRAVLSRAFLRVSVRYVLRGVEPEAPYCEYIRDLIISQERLLNRIAKRRGTPISGFNYDTLARASALFGDDPQISETYLDFAGVAFEAESNHDLARLKKIATKWEADTKSKDSDVLSGLGVISGDELDEFLSRDVAHVDFLRQYWTTSTLVLVKLSKAKNAQGEISESVCGEIAKAMNKLGVYIEEKQVGHAREMFLLLNGYLLKMGVTYQ